MRLRLAGFLLVLGMAGLVLWRAELFTVSRPGERPLPLTRTAPVPLPAFDVSLPVVPVGIERLTPGGAALLVHYWAPWERHSRAQALALDTLVRALPPGRVRVAIVCFDPFPSVARYAARLRLTVPVMLDLKRSLQAALPCPSIPYTWLIDAHGVVVARQAGEVDWLSPATRSLLLSAAGDDPAAGGKSVSQLLQTRAVAAPGRGIRRMRMAYPPNSAAL